MNSSPLRSRPLQAALIFTTGLAVGWLGNSMRSPGPSGGDGGESKSGITATGNEGRGTGTSDHTGGRTGEGKMKPLPAASSTEFAESVRAIFRDTDEERRVAAFDRLLNRATPAHLAALVDLIRENDLNGNGSNGEWSHLWARWGQVDALGALQFVDGRKWDGWAREAPDEAKRKAMAAWVETDSNAALQYFKQSGEIEKGDRSMVYPIVRGLANSDPDAAAKWLVDTGLGMRDEYRAVIDAQRRSKGMGGADDWFDQLSSQGAPEKDLAGLAKELISSRQSFEPDKAADWISAHLGTSWMDNDSVTATASAYAARNPEAAVNWAEGIQNSPASVTAWNTWARSAPDAAATWLESHEDSPSYANIAFGTIRYLSSDPDRATRIANAIQDENSRKGALEYVAKFQVIMKNSAISGRE